MISDLIPGNRIPTDCPGGRKIPSTLENPVDNLMIAISKPVQPILKHLKVSPNLITIAGILVRLLALFHLSTGRKDLFFLEALFSYYLDCLDGNYARNYNMCTVLGDYLDHFSDIIFHGIILYYLFFQSTLWQSKYFYHILIGIVILTFLMCWHFGYQEHHYKSENCESHTLKFLKLFATEKNKHLIVISRFFGCGTLALIIYALLYIY